MELGTNVRGVARTAGCHLSSPLRNLSSLRHNSCACICACVHCTRGNNERKRRENSYIYAMGTQPRVRWGVHQEVVAGARKLNKNTHKYWQTFNARARGCTRGVCAGVRKDDAAVVCRCALERLRSSHCLSTKKLRQRGCVCVCACCQRCEIFYFPRAAKGLLLYTKKKRERDKAIDGLLGNCSVRQTDSATNVRRVCANIPFAN